MGADIMSRDVGNCERSYPGLAVLVVDDDPIIRDEMCTYLGGHGICAESAADVAGARRKLTGRRFSMIILDLWLGRENGFDFLREMRKAYDIPCIMMTAQDDITDKIVGLELGADEYLFKPVNLRELLARIRTLLRRTGPVLPAAVPTALAGWHFDPVRRNLLRPDGKPEPLTSAECDLLIALTAREGHVLSRDALSRQVFRRSWDPADRSLDGLVVKLRRKLEPGQGGPGVIKTVRGRGYVFTGFSDPD